MPQKTKRIVTACLHSRKALHISLRFCDFVQKKNIQIQIQVLQLLHSHKSIQNLLGHSLAVSSLLSKQEEKDWKTSDHYKDVTISLREKDRSRRGDLITCDFTSEPQRVTSYEKSWWYCTMYISERVRGRVLSMLPRSNKMQIGSIWVSSLDHLHLPDEGKRQQGGVSK